MPSSYIPKSYGLLSGVTADDNGTVPTEVTGFGLGKDYGRVLNAVGLLPGPAGFGSQIAGGLFTGLNGDRFTNYDNGFFQDKIDNPGLLARASNWLGRQLGGTNETYADTYRGATDPEMYGLLSAPQSQQPFPQPSGLLASDRALAPRDITPAGLSAAEVSLLSAYKPSYYDTAGGGWKSGEDGANAQTGYKGGLLQTGGSGGEPSPPWSPWYAGQPDPFDLTGNMAAAPWAGDFGSGRYAYGDGLATSISGDYFGGTGPSLDPASYGGFGPMARFDSDPFGTN